MRIALSMQSISYEPHGPNPGVIRKDRVAFTPESHLFSTITHHSRSWAYKLPFSANIAQAEHLTANYPIHRSIFLSPSAPN